jgi:hypothetical protein
MAKRTLDEIQREYSQACMELGQLVYQESIVQEDLQKRAYAIEKLQKHIKSLNQEGHKLQQAPVEAVVKPEESAVEVPNEQQS